MEPGIPTPRHSQTGRVIAVIDIGATSIRMAISQVTAEGTVEKLESLSQAVSLGKDSFIKGYLESETIEECVRVLRIYRSKLQELGISDARDVHVVATSAVREARNRLLFQDRIFIATGFEIEPFDEAELHRVTYLGIQPILKSRPKIGSANNVICEVGGGSTELLVVEDGNVSFSETYRMGSLRLRKTMEAIQAPVAQWRKVMVEQIRQVVSRFRRSVPNLENPNFIGMGGDLRFACSQIFIGEPVQELRRLTYKQFSQFAEPIVSSTPDKILNQYSLSLPEAESIGPALLAYAELIKALDLESFYVSNTNMRDGLIREMVMPDDWGQEFREQVIRFSLNLGRKYQFDEKFALRVADLARQLFRQLVDEHELDGKYELILYVAALLHEIGLFIGQRGYHKHSLYLIRNSEFFGLGQKDILLVGLVARYHRRAHPQPNHDGYSSLDRIDRVTVSKLSALLRVALSLNASRKGKIKTIECKNGSEIITMKIPARELSIEKLTLQQAGTLFRETFGKRIMVTEV